MSTATPELPPAPSRAARWVGSIAVRLAAVTVLVSFAAIVVFAGASYIVDRHDVDVAARQQQAATVTAVATAAEQAYLQAGSWSKADLAGAAELAVEAGFAYRIVDTAGRTVTASAAPAVGSGRHQVQQALIAAGLPIGTLSVTEPSTALTAADRRLRASLSKALPPAAAAATLVAFLAAWGLARRLSRPLRALAGSVRAYGAGEVPPDEIAAVAGEAGEIGDLAVAFQVMVSQRDLASRLRREMIADVAHELRYPISVLQGQIEAIQDGVTEPDEATMASLHEESVQLGRIVDDLQAWAAAQAAVLDLNLGPVDLAVIAERVSRGQQPAAATAGVALETDLSPVTVSADPARLQQIATNLINNAIKYTPAGGRVQITTRRNSLGQPELTVVDTGPGIPADQLERIFDRFHRGDHDAIPGSGIGLAVTAALVQAHNATISITSPALGGTRATVTFPDPRRPAPPAT